MLIDYEEERKGRPLTYGETAELQQQVGIAQFIPDDVVEHLLADEGDPPQGMFSHILLLLFFMFVLIFLTKILHFSRWSN